MSEMEPITEQGLADLKAELERLEGEERRKVAERILRARELGDLSENAEYHAAKDDQAHLETRILKLKERERNAKVVEVAGSGDEVAFGSTVTFTMAGKEQTFKIVGTTEQDLKAGKLSAESPMARALMGAKVGEKVAFETPGGKRELSVVSVA